MDIKLGEKLYIIAEKAAGFAAKAGKQAVKAAEGMIAKVQEPADGIEAKAQKPTEGIVAQEKRASWSSKLQAKKPAGKLPEGHIKGGIAAGLGLLFAVTALSVSTLFDSPAEIVSPEVLSPTPVVDTISMSEALETAPEAEKHKARKKTLRQSAKEKIAELPAAVRVGVVLPLYIVGMVLTKLLGAFFSTVMAPVLASVLKWVLFALVIFLAIGLVIKALFPDVPLSKIFTLKNFLLVLGAVVVISLIDKAMPPIFSDYSKWADAFKFTAGLLIVIMTVVPVATHYWKKQRDRKAMQTI